MGKNRRIPFGYTMINGEMKADPTEMQAVTKIFLEYISGNSLKNIAKLMETMGIPYYKGEPAIWNASMVKRIIENKIYPGSERYPKIIDSSVYNRANELKKAKANNLCLVPEKFKELRDMIVCAECGKRLFRNADDTWNCKAENCRRLSYNVTDQMIESAVLNMMNSAIANPNLVEAEGELSKYTPNGAVMRQKNEIDRLMDSTAIDFDKIKKAMVRLAEIKYECCSYNDIPQQTGFLKLLFARVTWIVKGEKRFMWRCISRIDHGTRFCKKSPSIREDKLQRTIVKAINDTFGCEENIRNILKSNAQNVFSGLDQNDVKVAEAKLREIDKSRNELISLIASGTMDEDSLDTEFQKLYEEEQKITKELQEIKSQKQISDNTRSKAETLIDRIENDPCRLTQYDDKIVRKLIECVKAISKKEILIVFKGGYEVNATIE